MALTLVVFPGWHDHVDAVWAANPGMVPVIKGNGYGFGRGHLAVILADRFAPRPPDQAEPTVAGRGAAAAAAFADIGASADGPVSGWTDGWANEFAVGTVHELADLPAIDARPVVLTPALVGEAGLLSRRPDAIATVGSLADVEALAEADRRSRVIRRFVIVKIRSSMRRYGVDPTDLAGLVAAAAEAGFIVHGAGVHLALSLSPDQALTEATTLLATAVESTDIDTFYVSHLSPEAVTTLSARVPGARVRSRIGTQLWLGDKQHLKLVADVAEVRPVAEGQQAGYRLGTVPADGHLVMVTAGTAHGVQALADGRSPFHFARTRLSLHEAPHMHTSMCFVPTGDPLPRRGELIDVQQPLTRVLPDIIRYSS
jgi:alanine racemase